MRYLNLFSWSYYYKDLSIIDLLVFTAIAFVLVSILLFYYERTSGKGNGFSSQIDIPIYNSKDILLQERVGGSNFALAEKNISITSKVIIYSLAIIIAVTSFSEFL